jgi:hypothetical protein
VGPGRGAGRHRPAAGGAEERAARHRRGLTGLSESGQRPFWSGSQRRWQVQKSRSVTPGPQRPSGSAGRPCPAGSVPTSRCARHTTGLSRPAPSRSRAVVPIRASFRSWSGRSGSGGRGWGGR